METGGEVYVTVFYTEDEKRYFLWQKHFLITLECFANKFSRFEKLYVGIRNLDNFEKYFLRKLSSKQFRHSFSVESKYCKHLKSLVYDNATIYSPIILKKTGLSPCVTKFVILPDIDTRSVYIVAEGNHLHQFLSPYFEHFLRYSVVDHKHLSLEKV